MRLIPLAAPLLFLCVTACNTSPPEPKVTVQQAWIRLPASPGQPAAGYFTATATTDGEELRQVTSASARVEMHETMSSGNMTTMAPLEKAAFGGKPLHFAPGGKHLMLMDLDPKLKAGGSLTLSFGFKQAPPVTVEARLLAAGEEPEEHGGH
jgi:copper(I)-binding protein